MTILDPSQLYFIPLGGSEQFGVNLNVYAYEGKLLAVDCGLGFADENYPGIDLLLPDPAFLEERAKDIAALIITHAHEDHIGAVAYLWPRLKCPVYCTEFTALILKEKFDEKNIKNAKINIVKPGQTVSKKPFDVQFIQVSHSIPEAMSLLISCGAGTVVHSGDWNMDPHPVLGPVTDPKPFQAAGKSGVLAYIGDSTNANIEGRSGSETDVEKGLAKLFKEQKGRIAVTIFASNVGRILSIVRAADKVERRVVIVGRSLHRMIGAARECGYLDGVPEFLTEDDLAYIPQDKLVIIATGSQGEARAALARIARGDHNVKLARGDTVIFSARAIPGNETEINHVKNNLVSGGIKVITPDDTRHVIHVSGHPRRDEISEMLQWVKPKVVVPVHGERVMLEAHAELARGLQVPQVIIPLNGSVIRLGPDTAQIVDTVPTGLLAVEPKRIIKSTHRAIGERKKLVFTGAIQATIVMDARGELLADPKVTTMGLIDESNEEEVAFEDSMIDEIIEILNDMPWEDRIDDHILQEEIRIGLRRFAHHFLGMKPKATVHVVRV